MTPRLTIDLDAIAANWQTLAARHGGATAAVVKADGYGLGAAAVARRLVGAGCETFFVAHPGEAVALREALGPTPLIAVLNGLSDDLAERYRAHDLVPVLGSLAEIARWQQVARRSGAAALPAMLHVDTGMCRLGLDAAELDRLVAEPGRLDGVRLVLVMTHLVSAETPAAPINAVQLARFAAACARLPPVPRSVANSSGMFLGPDFDADLARPGAALYGINPQPGRPNPMRPVVRLAAPVLQLRSVAVGETVGYNGIWTARRPSRIATVPVGYADGYLRALSNGGLACFDGRPVPLVGRVSMDLTTWDVTDHPTIERGSWLELIGPSMPADEVAARAGTNGYEILTSLGGRYDRHYAAL